MSIIHALILSIIEGITEFLPVSSTGHLVLTAKLLGISETDFVKSFEIIIQLGAILAIAVLYWRRFLTDKKTLLMTLVAFIPTGILGLTLYKLIKGYLLGNNTITLLALFLGGIAIIGFEYYFKNKQAPKEKIKQLNYKEAVSIGLFQSVAMVPGVSRSAAAIFGGMIMGLSREQAVEFSFLLAVPTMLAASGLDFVENRDIILHSGNFGVLVLGFVASFVVALFVVKWLLQYIKTHTFIPFGVYRIFFSLLYFFLFMR